ncbi:hypothetical protein Tco_0333370 [Tanacetum coccineum]
MEAVTTTNQSDCKLPYSNPHHTMILWLMRTVGTVEREYKPTIAEEKQDRRNEMKSRATLLMAPLNKDQLKFHSYQDAKLLMKSIEKRYGGNKESKKVQRTLLKQQYENFVALSSETMDQTFDRLQKLISQLEIQREVINQEDMNLKLLRSLPSEWKTHALIWRNKVEIETISLDDLHKNIKIYESELTRSASTSQNPQNVAFVSNNTNSNNSANEADNTAYRVITAHTQSSPTSGDNIIDVVIYAFLASQPNSPQMSREDIEQIDPDDLEEIDLQWEMAMLTIRARRFIKRIGRQLDVNGKRVGFDRTKVECYNLETPTQNALIAQDRIKGYGWSYQAKEEQPTNYALMASTSSESSSSSDSEVDSCSKTCVKVYATLKKQYDSLSSDYKKSQFNLVSYKAGLKSIEARLAHYKKNEIVFEESINVLKLEVRLRDNSLDEYKMNLEKAEKERDQLKQTLEKFQNSSKSLNDLLESQSWIKIRLSHSVPPPLTGNFIPRKPDLTFIDKIVESENMDVTKHVCVHLVNDKDNLNIRSKSNKVLDPHRSQTALYLLDVLVGDEAVHKELGDRMERAATTASSLEAEQDSENHTIYTSLIQQFWETASASTSENEEIEITATIDGRVKTITEASIRRHLKLEDSDGIPTVPNAEIFEQLALMGYASDSDKLTFQKGHFSLQWRFLIHTILHCLSPKKTA